MHERISVPNAIDRQNHIKSVILVSAGNFLDMWNFMMFGYYAPWISKTFFPRESEFASLMFTFAIFGAGFLMRPIGGVVLGAYVDRRGRRSGLILILALMAVGTISIAFTPGYTTLGILAPILVLMGRLLQGFSAGAQVGSASVYLSEMATPGNKGFYVAWQSASQQVAVVVSALFGIFLSKYLSPSAFSEWGWRLPFIVGCLVLPFIFILRSSLEETPVFIARKVRLSALQVFGLLVKSWRWIVIGTMLVTMTTAAFYLITAYSPTYGTVVLHLSAYDGLMVTMFVGISNFVLMPIMGALSDRIGRRPLLISCTLLTLITCYPAMSWLVGRPSFAMLLMVELWLSLVYAGYNGAMGVYLTEIIPAEVRSTGFSLAYSLATALFGGFTPVVCTYLIHATGDKAMPGTWLSIAAVCALIATVAAKREESKPLRLSPCETTEPL
jgi:MFS transporter, MHS family, citrate/tricarballylate:H+ symporter